MADITNDDITTDRASPHLIEVLDRVLDKGIVIVYEIDVSVAGLRAIEITGDVVIASIETYLRTERALAMGEPLDAVTDAVDAYLREVQFPDQTAPH